MHIRQRTNGPLCGRAAAGADGRGALRRAPPAALQLIQGGVELPPLAAGEKAPLQRVLQAFIVLAVAAPGDFRASAADAEPVQDGMVPGTIVGTFPHQCVQLGPGTRRYGLGPTIEVAQY